MIFGMTRAQASILHFCGSSIIVGSVLAVVFLLWYPYPYFSIIGAMDVVRVLVLVDLVVGPLLTLILYKPNKWGLKFDMACVLLLQLSALTYGTYMIYSERPYYMVFAVDRFEVVPEKIVDMTGLAEPELLTKPWAAPIYAVASLPTSREGRERVMDEVLFEGKPDIHQRAEFWESYSAARHKVAAEALPLTKLAETYPLTANRVADALEDFPEQDIVYVPVIAHGMAKTLLLDEATLLPVGVLDIDPWAGVTTTRNNL